MPSIISSTMAAGGGVYTHYRHIVGTNFTQYAGNSLMPSVTKLTREDATPLETKLEYLASCMIKEKNLISLGLNVDWSSTLFLAARMCLVDYKQINECFYWGEFRGWVYKRVDMEINCGDYHAGFKTYNTMVLTHLFREIIKQTPPLDLDVWTK